MLHLIFERPDPELAQRITATAEADDVLLLLEQAVVMVWDNNNELLENFPGRVCVLRDEDSELSYCRQAPKEAAIDYEQFVALTCEHTKSISWR